MNLEREEFGTDHQTAMLYFKQSFTLDPNGTLGDWNSSSKTNYFMWTRV